MSVNSDIYQKILWVTNPYIVSQLKGSCVISGINSLFLQSKNVNTISHPFHILFPINLSIPDNTYSLLKLLKDTMNTSFKDFNKSLIEYIETLYHNKFDFHYEGDKLNKNNNIVYAFGYPIGIFSITNPLTFEETYDIGKYKYHRKKNMEEYYDKQLLKYSSQNIQDDYIKCLTDNEESNSCFFKRYCYNMDKLLKEFVVEPCFRLGSNQIDSHYCESKVIIGIEDSFVNVKLLNTELLSSNNPTIKNENLYLPTVKKWTINSTSVTNIMKDFIFRKNLSDKTVISEEIKLFISTLQKACSLTILPHDVTVYKCMRTVFYNSLKTNTAFEVGGVYQQNLFNSTSISKSFDTSNFSELEFGNCGFIITLPKGTKCCYIGDSRERTQYDTEYELLLPVGCKFKILSIIKDSYIYSYGQYRKITYYNTEYIPPPDSYFVNFDMDTLPLKLSDLVFDNNNEDTIYKEIYKYFKKILYHGIQPSFIENEISFIASEEKKSQDYVKMVAYNVARDEGIFVGSINNFLKNYIETPLGERKYKNISLGETEKYIKKYVNHNDFTGLSAYLNSINHDNEKLNGTKIVCSILETGVNKGLVSVLLNSEIMDYDTSIYDCFIKENNPYSKLSEILVSKVVPTLRQLQKAIDVQDEILVEEILKGCMVEFENININNTSDTIKNLFKKYKDSCEGNKIYKFKKEMYDNDDNEIITGNIDSFFENHIDIIGNHSFVWGYLCENNNISEDFFERHFKKINSNLTNMGVLCKNENISEDFFERHIKEVKWSYLCGNPNISEQFFERHIKDIGPNISNWTHLSGNPNISEKFFERHMDFVLFPTLCGNPNISEKFFERYDENIDWDYLCINNNISEKFFEKHLEKVNWISLCKNNNISEKFFEKHLEEVKWDLLCMNNNISEEFFERHLDDIDLNSLCKNDNISEGFFERHLNKVNWDYLCTNKNISEEFFERYLNKANWDSLCTNKNISEGFFEKHLEEVKWDLLCMNNNISEGFFEKHLEEVRWDSLCFNNNISEVFFERHFNKFKFKYIDRLFRNPMSRFHSLFLLLKRNEKLFFKDPEIKFIPWGLMKPYLHLVRDKSNLLKIKSYPGDQEKDNFFEKHLEEVKWVDLCGNNNISEGFFEKHLEKVKWISLCVNNNISEGFFEKHLDKVNWYFLCSNNNISEGFFEKHLYKVNWDSLCVNNNISEGFFEKHLEKVNWISLCKNNNISEGFFEKHLEEVKWDYLCKNDNISERFFEKHLYKVNWDSLCMNNNISEGFFERYLEEVDWDSLCTNNNISEVFFEKHLEEVNWGVLCGNNNISEGFFEKHLEEVNWYYLCSNNNISEGFFEKHLYGVNWDSLCTNNNISEGFFEKHLDKVNWDSLCGNPMSRFHSLFLLLKRNEKLFFKDPEIKFIPWELMKPYLHLVKDKSNLLKIKSYPGEII